MMNKLSILTTSLIMNIILIILSKKLNVFIDSPEENKPHTVHRKRIPRIGGLAIFLTFILFSKTAQPFYLAIASIPLIAAGVREDFKRTSHISRFILIGISAALSIKLLNAQVTDIDIVKFSPIVALIFTIVAFTGVSNAFNIIDGLNGLSSGIAVIILAFFYAVAGEYNLQNIQNTCNILILSILGFFILNYPAGEIFLGDTGGYFTGFCISVLSSLIVKHSNGNISAWFPLVLVFYPVWETVFSAVRRISSGENPFKPDKLHTHHLLMKLTNSNPVASGIILIFQIIISFIALEIHNRTWLLISLFVTLIIIHTIIYNLLIKTIGRSECQQL